LFVGDVISVVG